MSMARGMADAMVSGRAAAAESDAAFAADRASMAEARASGARIRATRAEQEAAGWKAEAERLHRRIEERSSTVSAGLIVINAFIKYMETMPVHEREKCASSWRRRLCNACANLTPMRSSVKSIPCIPQLRHHSRA